MSSSEFEAFVSVIVPTLNEEKYIGRFLESFAVQTYPKDKFEVLIVDGMSSDKTVNIAKSYAEKIDLRILENRKVKHVFALNDGVRQARGDFFVIVGGHSFVEKDFLEKNVETFVKMREREPKLAAVGGSLEIVHENSFARLVSLLFVSPFSGGSSFWYSEVPHFAKTVIFGFYDKRIVEKIGCFDEDMIKGQDFEINLRLYKNGYKLYDNPEVKSYYYARNSFGGFFKQAFDNGVAKGLCVRKGYFSAVWFVPLAFIFYQLFLLAGVFLSNLWLLVLFAPFVVYWVLNFLFSVGVWRKRGGNIFLPVMFWILHNVTGVGFLAGLILGKRSLRL
jgi:glycosyltransferase involved in cell wall biosynthesis